VFFKTRNSIRLENHGMFSNKCYLITKLVRTNGPALVEFLEIDQNRVYRGKYSKGSMYWNGKAEIVDKNMINLDKNCKENYFGLKEVLKISR
jgi:hypothetical protein